MGPAAVRSASLKCGLTKHLMFCSSHGNPRGQLVVVALCVFFFSLFFFPLQYHFVMQFGCMAARNCFEHGKKKQPQVCVAGTVCPRMSVPQFPRVELGLEGV